MNAQPLCPYLYSDDAHSGDAERRAPAQPYPSFENRCAALAQIPVELDGLESGETLLLRDQGAFCLGPGHRLCPRFQALHGEAVGLEPPLGEAEPPLLLEPEPVPWDAYDARPRRLGFWLSLAVTLAVLLFCGGSVAAYMGWQLIGRTLTAPQRLAAPSQATQPPGPVFLLVTATPVPDAPASVPVATATPTPTFVFPAAVTPTPIPPEATSPPPVVAPAGPIVITTPTPRPPDPAAPDLATAVAGPVVITTPGSRPPTPTRRPTPAPGEAGVPIPETGPTVIVVTATPTPDLPEPVVSFRSAHQSVLPGDCTTLLWDVENARAVFLDNEGVPGHGERRVCLRWTSQTFVLSVVGLDGAETLHRVTVQLVPHTPTPTVTPTMTPVFTPTPTWTPEGGPPATPAPPQIAVTLIVDGGNQITCTPGQQCQAVLQVGNAGELADEIFVNLSKDGPWPAQICRADDICGDSVVSQGIGAGGQAAMFVRVHPPGDATGAFTFRAEAVSGNSGHTITSGPVSVTFRVGQ